MSLPKLRVTDEFGDIRVVFQGQEFERPHLFHEWITPIIRPIVNQFIGLPSGVSVIYRIEAMLGNSLKSLIYYNKLWYNWHTRKWDFEFTEKPEPNNLMKELI